MLARPNRLTRGADYKAVVRRGRRCAAAHTVTYVNSSGDESTPRFGFIVSRLVNLHGDDPRRNLRPQRLPNANELEP